MTAPPDRLRIRAPLAILAEGADGGGVVEGSRIAERVIARSHDPAEGAMIQVALAPCSPFPVTPERMRGAAGVGVRHCPTSNMTLASGRRRTRELEAAGAKLGLGVDGSASNDSSNMMEGVRHALPLGRLTYDATLSHQDDFRRATEGSAACLGRDDIGTIAVGMQADLALFTLDELRFSGAGDPLAALVLCGAHRAERVMIAGRWTVVGGQPVGIDIARLRAEHGRAARRYLEQTP